MKPKKFSLRMESDFHNKLKNISKKERTSIANVIIRALLEKYSELKKEINDETGTQE